MGTPHQGGSGVQLGRILINIASLFTAADDHLLKHLERDSEWLQHGLERHSLVYVNMMAVYRYDILLASPKKMGHLRMYR